MSNKAVYALLFALLLVLVLLAIRVFPFSYAEGDFALNALETVKTGHVSSTFLPDFYPFLCGRVYRLVGGVGVIALQAAMYLGTAAALFATLHGAVGAGRSAAIAAFTIMLDPDLLSSIPKLWDTEITVLLLSSLVCFSLTVRPGVRWPVALLGVVWGLGLAVRPNFASMALPIGYALWLAYRRRAPAYGAAVTGLALLTLAAANTAAHGSFYLPQNGPYNFFAGANPHTQWALLHAFNAEPSVDLALADHGLHPANHYALSLRPLYTRLALSFVAAHPLTWLWLGVVKLATLLRPDTKVHPLLTGAGLVKLATSLPAPVWLAVLALTRRLEAVDRIMIAFAAAYVLPFVLTNADPRFRVALDVLLLTHLALFALRAYLRTDTGATARSFSGKGSR